MKPALQNLLLAALACALVLAQTCHAGDMPYMSSIPTLAQGATQCDHGHYTLAVETLNQVIRRQPAGPEQVRAAGALGLTYLRMRQPALAQHFLRIAFDGAGAPQERARYGLDLANLLANQRDFQPARQLYAAVLQMAPDDAALHLSVALNSVPMAPAGQRLSLLQRLRPQVQALPRLKDRAVFFLNLGAQARAAIENDQARQLAYLALTDGLQAAKQLVDKHLGDPQLGDLQLGAAQRLIASAQNQLAQLYEDAQRTDEALLLTTQGIVSATALMSPEQSEQPDAGDLLIELEWRRGRLLAAQGQLAPAIGAYQRAVNQIEAIRQDIPIEYENGKSSFRDTLEPVYLGLADLMLQQAEQLEAAQQGPLLRRVRDMLERIKQTELEDFLGSRCAVDGARQAGKQASRQPVQSAVGRSSVAHGTAVLYPVILPDRLELLIETAAGIERRTVPVPASALRRDATAFAAALRARKPYLELAQRLHLALLAPAATLLQQRGVKTLVLVPDSVLRLVPFGALHDGQRFAIESYAMTVVPAVSLPAVSLPDGGAQANDARPVKFLLAGMSEPGGVVEKLPDYMTAQLLADEGSGPVAAPAGARSMFTRGMVKVDTSLPPQPPLATATSGTKSVWAGTPAERAARRRTLQERLALSGVAEEVVALAQLAPSTTMLNQGFSVRTFSDQVRSGNYRVVHIASHGVFGGSANATFIMAHDDLITIDQLQALLRGPGLRERPIELLTLSACETAEGDDRAPLGLSGAALKAQAHSALGSLWPVSDDAAKVLMGDFYRGLVQTGLRDKAQALQAAQVRMIGQTGRQHPYYWAPFILVERRL